MSMLQRRIELCGDAPRAPMQPCKRRVRLPTSSPPAQGRSLPEQAQSEKSQGVRGIESPESFDNTVKKTENYVSVFRGNYMQRQRYWVERCFEDGKSECGMADYQLRLWNAWHHHMALVMMAMLFMLSEKLRMQKQCPLLSCADIERLLATFLPRRDAGPEQVLNHMHRRHEMRRRAIDSHARCNGKRRSKIT